MKVLMVNYEFPPLGGGAGRAHAALCRCFAAMSDLRVDVVTSGTRPGVTRESLADRVTVHRVGIRKADPLRWTRSEVLSWLRRACGPYRRLLAAGDYDLVHAFFAFPSGWLSYRTRRRCPYLLSLRGSDVPGRNARLQREYRLLGPWVFRPIWRHAAGIVACSRGLRERALRFLPGAAIQVIPNGVDGERFHPAATPADGGPLRLLTVGRLSETKRVDLLIEAVSLLTARGVDVRLTIVGSGGLRASLESLTAARGLRDRVDFTGTCDAEAMPERYRGHDLYVSATLQEGMSNAMLEAMASGLPLVTTRCEGLEELIDDNGRIVADTAAALADAVAALAADPATRARMGRAARERAQRFTWQAAALAYRAQYERLLGGA